MTATKTFEWVPLLGTTGATTDAVKEASFGDGYDQVAEDGINNRRDSWPVSFIGDEEKIVKIKEFLDWHAGAKSFWWQPPLRKPGRFRASDRTITPNGNGIYTLNATFKETFAP